MKDKAFTALITTSQALSVTSQLLAIGIEVGIIVGGYFLYRKICNELSAEAKKEEATEVAQSSKPTFKQAWAKTKAVYQAVFS